MTTNTQALADALKMAIRQNAHDMVMTGEEIRQCEAALASLLQKRERLTVPDGYAAAFYELAALMGLPAQPKSPATVWREQMLPRLRAALAAPELLAALQSLVGEWPQGEGMTLGERVAQAHAAIRKATLASRLQEKEGQPSTFPVRILTVLHELADRKGTPTHGPAEDANGEPLQDDADTALAWIAARATLAAGSQAVQVPGWMPIDSERKTNEQD